MDRDGDSCLGDPKKAWAVAWVIRSIGAARRNVGLPSRNEKSWFSALITEVLRSMAGFHMP